MAKKTNKKSSNVASNPKYQGKYVAFAATGTEVIAAGKDPSVVINRARKKGIKVPSIEVIIPENAMCAY